MNFKTSNASEKTPSTRRAWFSWGLLACVLILCAAAYRVVAAHVLGLATQKIVLPVPLSDFPKEIGDWRGEDQELTPEVIRIAGNDDYVTGST